MNLSSEFTVSTISGAFSWWLEELKVIFGPLSRFMTRNRPELIFTPADDHWTVSLRKGRRLRNLTRVDFGSRPTAIKKAIRPIFKSVKIHDTDVTILLAEGNALRRTLEIPSVAASDIRQLLSFEIDRQTPFEANDVYFDYRVLTRDPNTQHFLVELVTVPRRVVDPVLKDIQNWGLQASRVDIAVGPDGHGLGVNLLRASDDRTGGNYFSKALFVVLMILSAAILVIPVRQLANVDDALKAELAKEKSAADQTMAMRDDLAREIKSAQFLDIRKLKTPRALVILNELTETLPDDTWLMTLLMTLQSDDNEVKISGYSTSAAQLISVLDDAGLFKEPTFTSSIVQDKRQKLERFELMFRVDRGE